MQRRVYELVSAIVLDPAIALTATADALVIATAVGASDEQALSIARGEAWRQLRARNIFAHDLPTFDPTADPVEGLTVMERTVLELNVRLKLDEVTVARIAASKPKQVKSVLRTARRELARTAIAGALLSNPSKCPVLAQAKETLNTTINRGQAMSLVSHSAECSICVPVLRTVDRQIMQNYIDVPVAQPPTELNELVQRDAQSLVERAKLIDGWAPVDSESRVNPRRMLMRGIVLGFVSAALIALALLVGR